MNRHSAISVAALVISTCSANIGIAGPDIPDVIVGELANTFVIARCPDPANSAACRREDNGIVSIATATTSCNAGTKVVDWLRLPSNKHPVIALNFYHLLDGNFQQIGMSW